MLIGNWNMILKRVKIDIPLSESDLVATRSEKILFNTIFFNINPSEDVFS